MTLLLPYPLAHRYNNNPEGKLTITSSTGIEVASVIQAHVTEEQAPGPGLDEMKQKLNLFKDSQA